MKNILISTGDHSADIHAAGLASEIKKLNSEWNIFGLGGEKLKNHSNTFLADLVSLDVSGFTQPFRQFFKLKNILTQKIFPILDEHIIDAVVLIDFYGFNIHIAKRAAKNGIPVYYFVSPQVWASRPGRIKKLKSFVKKMFVIFPFEEKIYRKNGMDAEFVGHPLWDKMKSLPQNSYQNLLQNPNPVITLMPGSRIRELLYHIPTLLQTYALLKSQIPSLKAKMLKVDFIPQEKYQTLIDKTVSKQLWLNLDIELVEEKNYDARRESILCLGASGTATLENTFLALPMVAIYQFSTISYYIAKNLIRVPYISMPNILASQKIVPELVQKDADPKNFFKVALDLLNNPQELLDMHEKLINVRKSFTVTQNSKITAYTQTAKKIEEELP